MDENQKPQAAPTPDSPAERETAPLPEPATPDATAPVDAAAKPVPKPAPKPAAAKAPAVMDAAPWEGEIPSSAQEAFGDGILRAATYREQDFFEVSATALVPLLTLLRDAYDYDYLVEETAVDYPKEEKRFELVYIVYSFERNHRIRLKTRVSENEEMASAVPVYAAANWMEREIYDMFGVRFAGHPDLRRILMPDEWQGHPLRKDYGIIQQDRRWVQENLGIESGQ